MSPVSPQNPWVHVAEIVRLIRSGEAQTRPELAEATRLGRNVVTLRIQAAADLGLVQPSGDARSRGGRAAEVWEFRPGEARLIVVLQALAGFRVALTDANLRVIARRRVPWPVTRDPEATCQQMANTIDELLEAHPGPKPWALALGLQGPVNYVTGQSADPVTPVENAHRWPVSFDARRWFVRRFGCPVWVESMSNLTAIGAAAAPGAPDDLITVRMGTGVGSAIWSGGRLHRGADWLAGEITHITVSTDPDRVCVCGRVGCLDAFSSEWAIEAEGRRVAAEGRSPHLAALDHPLEIDDITAGAALGDVTCIEIVLRAADALGRALAAVVTWFNPRRVVILGNSLTHSSTFQSAVRRTLNTLALAASIQNLELIIGGDETEGDAETLGAMVMLLDRVLSPTFLPAWGPLGAPGLVPDLLTRKNQL